MTKRHSVTAMSIGRSLNMLNIASEHRGSTSSLVEKAKLTQLLKTTQTEQLTKLQNKHQQECDLLDDIRNFSKQKSQIERDYGQALQKVILQYQKREWFDGLDEDDDDQVSVLRTWKEVLDTTAKTAQSRINAAENYKNNICEASKTCRAQKDVQLKRSQELLNTIHNELFDTVRDLARTKKKYFEMEQMSILAKEKCQDVNHRLKKNQTSLFKSKSVLEKAALKHEQKRDEYNRNTVVARNDYLLMLSAANAHQKRYYEVDLPETIKILDGNIFEDLRGYFGLLNEYELELAADAQKRFSHCSQFSTRISREFQTRCFMRENPVFEWAPLYEFESLNPENKEGKLVEEQPGSDNSLNREARKWTFKVERDKQALEVLWKRRNDLESLILNSEQHPEKTAAEGRLQDTKTQLQKCNEEIRQKETSCLLGDSRLALLLDANVNLDSWFESARVQLLKKSSASSPGGISLRKVLTSPAKDEAVSPNIFSIGSGGVFFDDDDLDSDEFEEDRNHDSDVDSSSLPSSERTRTYPVTCVVSFSYQATRDDELTIAVGDRIEVVEDGDLDQWVKGRNESGKVGYVPENYLEFPGCNDNGSQDLLSLNTPPDGFKLSSYANSPVDQEVMDITKGSQDISGVNLAKAIYSYEACTDDELSFPTGAVISIITKNDNGVDDGWWKGELNGKIGVFPAVVVEELTKEEENFNSDNLSFESFEIDQLSPDQPAPLLPLPSEETTIFLPLAEQDHAHDPAYTENNPVEIAFPPPNWTKSIVQSAPSKQSQIISKIKRKAPSAPKRPPVFRHSFNE